MTTHVIGVTDQELALLTSALRSFLSDFGHEQADLVRQIQDLLAKLPNADHPRVSPTGHGPSE